MRKHQYDIVGISSIIVNVGKVREMCRMIREISPQSEIVIGGHVTATPGIEQMVDADHYVRGEGIAWMRASPRRGPQRARSKHPLIASAFGRGSWAEASRREELDRRHADPVRRMSHGVQLLHHLLVLRRQRKVHQLLRDRDELFEVMCKIEEAHNMNSFFIMDENFLLNKKRALELLGHMKAAGKSWELNVFSSANAIKQYTMERVGANSACPGSGWGSNRRARSIPS